MLAKLAGLRRFGTIALVIALAAALAWGFRVNSIRDDLRGQLADISATAATIGGADVAPTGTALSQFIVALDADRDVHFATAIGLSNALRLQTQAVENLVEQEATSQRQSADAVAKALDLIRSRDAWVTAADTAAKRTTPLDDAGELKQCKEAADALYQAGF